MPLSSAPYRLVNEIRSLSPRVPFQPARNGLPTFQPGKTRPGVIAIRVGEAACSISCEVWSAVPAVASAAR